MIFTDFVEVHSAICSLLTAGPVSRWPDAAGLPLRPITHGHRADRKDEFDAYGYRLSLILNIELVFQDGESSVTYSHFRRLMGKKKHLMSSDHNFRQSLPS